MNKILHDEKKDNKFKLRLVCNSFLFFHSTQVLIAGTFKGMKIKPGSFGKASPGYDVQVQ